MDIKKILGVVPAVIVVIVVLGVVFKGCGGGASNSSSLSESSSSESSESRTCTQCGDSYTGNGWSTVGGEQFEYSSDPGYDVCCSKSCAYESQPNKWK